MRKLLALPYDGDEEALEPVVAGLVRVLQLEPTAMTLPPAAPLKAALAAVEVPEVVVVVLASSAGDDLVHELLLRCPKPVVLVPPQAPVRAGLARVLVPLDGSDESATAVASTLALFAQSGLDLVVLHVLRQETTPRFWDQPVHARQTWEAEFLARTCPHATARLELRRGVPGEGILDVARAEEADLIALGWSQPAGGERAKTVWATVAGAQVPVMLLPVDRVIDLTDPAVAGASAPEAVRA